MKKKFSRLTLLSLLISYSLSGLADDGEIFFNDKLTPENPNVIFLLDASGSMTTTMYTSTGERSSRIGVLKSSLTKLLEDKNETTDIRAGMMRFASDSLGISILEQVADIESNRQKLIQQTKNLIVNNGATPTIRALYEAGLYITNSSNHKPISLESPIREGCQLSHIILMSDGQPYNSNSATQSDIATVQQLLGISSCVITNNFHERCGRELVKWLATTDQAPKLSGDNFIRTHTIGFALGSDANAKKFLSDLASEGQGKAYEANSDDTLLAAFKEIISDVRAADSPSASGTVTVGEQVRYEQRTEVFYSLFSSDAYNYWPGNMKRFKIEYIETPLTNSSKKGLRAVLVDKNGESAMSPDGTFYSTASSFWSNQDGGKVQSGGVVGQLKSPDNRAMFTLQNQTTKVDLKPNPTANINLGVSDLNVKNALLNFIRGYTYVTDTNVLTVADKKIGDAARGRISLASYGCMTSNDKGKSDIMNCKQLNQVALLASNDGFFRGYDIQTGEALFEYMPEEMLPLIQKLQRREVVSFKKTRYYGLDGKPVIYHDDKNNDGYINNSEKAYAYIAAGRGGPYIYALDITDIKNPTLKWQIDNKKTGFSQLGYTWSTPVLGKIQIGDSIKNVLVFGGGYDKSPQDEDTQAIRQTTKGNIIYIVDAETGNLLWSYSGDEMKYSIPSAVALATDGSKNQLVTDIIVGDMGGQVWRFNVDNNQSKTNNTPVISGKVIAKLADSSSEGERKFYQPPSLYETEVDGKQILFVNIGSGFRNHPLNMVIKDKIYSLRISKNSTNQKVITEDMLGVASTDGQSITGNITYGFMIELSAEGEKVITDGYADFDRIVFNTFIPFNTDKRTCVPSSGTQRTYNYDLLTGKSLLETAFISIGITALPPDVTAYCNGRYCTIISDPSLLSMEKPLPKGKDKDAFVVDTGESIYIKTGWTDQFDISPKK